jgi:hypothetical protein
VALVRKQTVQTERPPLVGEVSANFCGERLSRGHAQRIPIAINFDFLDPEPLLFHLSKLLTYPLETELTPFQTHYFSENLVAPGVGPGISGSVARNSDH